MLGFGGRPLEPGGPGRGPDLGGMTFRGGRPESCSATWRALGMERDGRVESVRGGKVW